MEMNTDQSLHINKRILDVLQFAVALNRAMMATSIQSQEMLDAYRKKVLGVDKLPLELSRQIHKVAAGIATAERAERIEANHMAEALQYTRYYAL